MKRVLKRPLQKVAQPKPKLEATEQIASTVVAAKRKPRRQLASALQQAAHDLLDQLGAARSSQQLNARIDKQQARRLRRLTALLDELRTEKQRNQKLQRVLTASEYDLFLQQAKAPLNAEQVLASSDLPDALKHYQQLVLQADRLNGLAESAATRKRKSAKPAADSSLRNRAEAAYERACEYLAEQIAAAQGYEQYELLTWLDRDFDYGPGGSISPDAAGVARIRGSNSAHCKVKSHTTLQEKHKMLHELQITAVSQVIASIIYEQEQVRAPDVKVQRMRMASLSPEIDRD